MVRRGDCASGTLRCANRPVLLKGCRALNRRRIGPSSLVDFVRASVAGDGSLVGQPCTGVVCTIVLDNVVLDERTCGPAIYGKIGVTAGAEGTRVIDRS